jgi:CRP/FNR family cyclic AMP-dependent transcriptional regulator
MQDDLSSLLSKELIAWLTKRGDLKIFARGERLITEGELSDSLYILVSGQLKVFTSDDKGRELIYNILQPGEFFGEMFLDGGQRSASVKAMVESKCVVLGHAKIRTFMKTYPEFAECVALKLIERLRLATLQIKSLVLSSVYERTVKLLDKVALQEGDVRVVPRSLTQQEIADRVGATREMINHILRNLTREGFLTKGKERRMVISRELPKQWGSDRDTVSASGSSLVAG